MNFDENILKSAIDTFGESAQVKKAYEELFELGEALSKLYKGKDTNQHVEEEIADVLIMIEQMKMIYGLNDDSIQAFIDHKLLRLDKLVIAFHSCKVQ